jgi:hypothetical protein
MTDILHISYILPAPLVRCGRRFSLIIAAAVAWPVAALAQDTGSVRATVVEAASQRPISGATVTIAAIAASATTDSAGVARFARVPQGLFSVAVRRVGFGAARQVNLRVTRSKTTIVQFQLESVAVALDVTKISSDPFPRDADQSVSRFVYTADEIRRTPGAVSDIFRAIETLPGVSSSGGEFSAFSVRGGGPRDNLILIDEIPFDKVTHLEGGIESDEAQGGRFSIFAPDLVQSADFRAGGFSAQYGGKSASVLSLQLRDGNTETPTVGGRYDLLGWETDYDGPSRLHAGTSVLFSARHENFARVLKLIGREDAGMPSFTDVIFKSTTTINARSRLTVLGVLAPEEVHRSVANILTESDTNDAALYRWKESKGILGVSWRLLAGSASVVQSSLYLRRFTRTNTAGEAYPDIPIDDGRTIASRPDVLRNDESETQLGFRSVAHLTHGRHTGIFSREAVRRSLVGGRSVSGADTVYTFDRNDPRPGGQYFIVVHPETYDTHVERQKLDLALSSSYQRGFGSDGSFTLGARYEHDGVSDRDNVVPRASATLPSIGGFSFSLAGGVYLQPLELKELTASAENALLAPERSTHAIIGVSRMLRPDVRVSVEGYHRTLNDLPIRWDRTSGLEESLGTGFANGVDVTLVKRLVDRFFGQASYSYSVSRRNDNRGEPTYDAEGNQPEAFTLLGGYTLNSAWSMSSKFKYATGKPTDEYIVHANVLPGSSIERYSQEVVAHNAARVPDLHTLNLRIDYQHRVRAVGIDAFLDVLNVYDRLNVNNVRFVERTGRTASDGVRIVPTFGLKALF